VTQESAGPHGPQPSQATTESAALTGGGGNTNPKSHHGDMLLSWWLAAAIVGADIGTSVFYTTGVILPLVGFAAPFVVLIVCLLMWFFKATYEEGCSVSPFNGGAYIMVLQTIGKRFAIVVGALTILSYLATAAVSALSGAFYIDSIDNIMNWPIASIVSTAIAPVIIFGLLNIIGIKEPAMIVFFIALFHFGLLLYMDVKGIIMAFERHLDFSRFASSFSNIQPSHFIHGFAAAFLGITGFESAAQIVEQLKTPTWKTLKQIYMAVVVLVGITAPITSFLCLGLLDNSQIHDFKNSLLSGLAYVEGGKTLLFILVVDAALMLFAAVNTAYVGCIGLCTTMAKQGNLPAFFLRRWAHKYPAFQGYPYVCLTFMAVCAFMIAILPGQVDNLGQVYGMAFLAVMCSFCLGVIMLRLKMPLKVARAPYKTKWVIPLKTFALPIPPTIGLLSLSFCEVVLLVSAEGARSLGFQILMVILIVMCFYRMGILEGRLRELPDLRLGMGKFHNMEEIPEDLPTFVLCTGGAKARSLATMLIKLLEREEPGPKEIIIFHAEEESARRGMMYELLQRVVSQQIGPSFRNHDIVLTVKILPESIVDGLIYLRKAHPFSKVFIGTGSDPDLADRYARDLENNLGVTVVNIGRPTLLDSKAATK
jgi:amino acid transporter